VTVPVAAVGDTVAVSVSASLVVGELSEKLRLVVVLVVVEDVVVLLLLVPEFVLCVVLLQAVMRETTRAKRTGRNRRFILLSFSGVAGFLVDKKMCSPCAARLVEHAALTGQIRAVAPACAPCRHPGSDTVWVARTFPSDYSNFKFSLRIHAYVFLKKKPRARMLEKASKQQVRFCPPAIHTEVRYDRLESIYGDGTLALDSQDSARSCSVAQCSRGCRGAEHPADSYGPRVGGLDQRGPAE
jgi:hypothetical protein